MIRFIGYWWILLLSSPVLQAQLHLTYGSIAYRKPFLEQLNTWNDPEWGKPIQIVGFHVNGPGHISGGSTNRDTYIDLQINQYLAQQIRINDSVSGSISGAAFGWSEAYDLFGNSKHIDLAIGGGFNFGRLKLTQRSWDFFDRNSKQLHLKNSLICPKGLIQFRVVTRNVIVMLTAEFQYDISGSAWKEKLWSRNKPDSFSVPGFNQTGCAVFAGIGWNLVWGPDDRKVNPEE